MTTGLLGLSNGSKESPFLWGRGQSYRSGAGQATSNSAVIMKACRSSEATTWRDCVDGWADEPRVQEEVWAGKSLRNHQSRDGV